MENNWNSDGGKRKNTRPEREYTGEKRRYGQRSTGGKRSSGGQPDGTTGHRSTGGQQAARRASYDRKRSSRFDEAARERLTAISENHAEQENEDSSRIEGRNAVVEALRGGRTIDRIYIQDGLNDGPVQTVKREAAKHGIPVRFVPKERLDMMSRSGHHQGVIADAAAYTYSTVDDMFRKAEERGEKPFFILLDDIEDPHNLGAIIRTANIAGAHGVIIPKDRACGLTATVVRASAGALNYTPVAKVTNLAVTIEELKKRGMWFVCADMDGTPMGKLDLTGPIGLVIGAEGSGVSRLVREKCDMVAAIPMRGEINSLNASVAAGVLSYEILRQRDAAAAKI